MQQQNKLLSPQVLVLCLLPTLIASVSAGVPPLPRYEALMKEQSHTELGLYNASDKVYVLTDANFKEAVLQQNRSALVEFYNSYCGHCKRFAPLYKQLAEQLHPWRDVLLVGAMDCAAENNNDICREYEVMSYPTLRYYRPGYVPSDKAYGRPIETLDLTLIRDSLVRWLAAENPTANTTTWPNLKNLTQHEAGALFEGLDSQRQLVVLVYDTNISTLGIETALTFLRWPAVQVRRIIDPELAAKFQMDNVRYKLATVDRAGHVTPYLTKIESASAYAEIVKSILNVHHYTEKPSTDGNVSGIAGGEQQLEASENAAIVAEVKRNKHFVYQADLELAVRGIIFNEIPKASHINGERLLAVQRLLAVLRHYNPLGNSGRTFINKLYDFVMQFNQQFTGKQFEDELARLEMDLGPIFSANHFVGCIASVPGLRGFTCSLWHLFHFMTVQAVHSETNHDPLEVLQALHSYAKYFFGCTNCAEHFQKMAARRKIWNVPNKDEAVLWLWSAHNEVNNRLAGDSTEDPKFPKIQFPSQSSCSQCYKNEDWNKDEVLRFLKNIYNPEYISRYGVEREELLLPTAEKLRQKRMLGNVFSDMDMRMGMLLYGFCIIMMVVAFKLFAFKGYRKKPYGHDVLGKV